MWERLKFTERFSFATETGKVQHVVVDEVLFDPTKTKIDHWYLEEHQTKIGIERVREWAKRLTLPESSLLISGNTDEVLSQDVLHQLRWCETQPGKFSVSTTEGSII